MFTVNINNQSNRKFGAKSWNLNFYSSTMCNSIKLDVLAGLDWLKYFRKNWNAKMVIVCMYWLVVVYWCVRSVDFVHRQRIQQRERDDVGFHVPILQHTCHELYWLNGHAHHHTQSQLHKYNAKLSHISI